MFILIYIQYKYIYNRNNFERQVNLIYNKSNIKIHTYYIYLHTCLSVYSIFLFMVDAYLSGHFLLCSVYMIIEQ